ncbi:polysaccharide pyruvyl transferase family protein [Tessaracoccus rhinocerotis]|uniref:Polysaccharide pyruvyl transferase family protein n=1 Tax=Tessaracoccus rhinocerotis TaxID=1689449 RepID=A0A553K1S9_9ACTN|nr:polysaccharide pyruvyl transferase family protein [Tessaracoccus rhinocerotis]TRY18635.1 polysaccharide pyruvyl transferase family protein [Tessaracoccus rhinocerotis]
MRIGFLGIQCDNPNLGVSALAYAGVNLIHQVTDPAAEFVLFSDNSTDGLKLMSDTLGLGGRPIRAVPFRHKSPRRLLHTFREMESCTFIVDFTGGDSFSDIYGLPRLLKNLLHKEMALRSGAALVLAPQTYGPFTHRSVLPWVRSVVERAELVFSRDEPSLKFLGGLTSRDVILTTDVAVTLPSGPNTELAASRPQRIGFNVSGLLWTGGYTGKNQFDLKVNYQEYCRGVVQGLLDTGHDVHLVSHVVPRDGEQGEGDVAACSALQIDCPGAQLAPSFRNPVEAKSWIAETDVFIGSRMHATIAAFTTGVATIPAAYSRKFAGLFSGMGYDINVDLKALGTQEAVRKTLDYVEKSDTLREGVARGRAVAASRISTFQERIAGMARKLKADRKHAI